MGKCYLCGKPTKRKEDIGGNSDGDNVVNVCHSCAILDRLRQYDDKEITLKELCVEVNDIVGVEIVGVE